MRALECVSDLLKFPHRSKKIKKLKQLQTVELKVRMDCDGCERKVRKAVDGMKGVTQVEVDRKQNKVTVIGYVDPKKVLKRVRAHTGKKVEPWPYVPYEVVPCPYEPAFYDKKAPPGYVRNAPILPHTKSPDEKIANVFSDDNPNSCAIM